MKRQFIHLPSQVVVKDLTAYCWSSNKKLNRKQKIDSLRAQPHFYLAHNFIRVKFRRKNAKNWSVERRVISHNHLSTGGLCAILYFTAPRIAVLWILALSAIPTAWRHAIFIFILMLNPGYERAVNNLKASSYVELIFFAAFLETGVRAT